MWRAQTCKWAGKVASVKPLEVGLYRRPCLERYILHACNKQVSRLSRSNSASQVMWNVDHFLYHLCCIYCTFVRVFLVDKAHAAVRCASLASRVQGEPRTELHRTAQNWDCFCPQVLCLFATSQCFVRTFAYVASLENRVFCIFFTHLYTLSIHTSI